MGDGRLDLLAERLGHRFADPELLREALTHPSIEGPPGRRRDYDRLEFVGDRVLGLVISEILYRRQPEADAGDLARGYNSMVRRESLAEVALALDLGDYLYLSRSERSGGGAAKPAILADACEAVIGALFLDGGFAVARDVVIRLWQPLLGRAAGAEKDAKTTLQEWAQSVGRGQPEYRLLQTEGPPHEPVFTVSVRLPGLAPASGRGRSKREAEQAAAGALLTAIPHGRQGDE